MEATRILSELGLKSAASGSYAGRWLDADGPALESVSPRDGRQFAQVARTSESQYDMVVEASVEAFSRWRALPAPQRGEFVRQIGEALRAQKDALAALVSLECGKILSEAAGEVQEMIDIADFAVGLSRTLGGSTLPSERPDHRLFEQWHPLGPVGVITAFNFPVAVWAWNAMIAAVAGDTVLWKPSEKTPLCAVAVTRLVHEVMEPTGFSAVFGLVTGKREHGERIAGDQRVPLVSATGSCRMGHDVAARVGARLGRSLLELGGNNGVVVLDDADLDLVVRAVVFGAVGTAGQRCTTTRRLIATDDIASELERRLARAYRSVPLGDPLAEGTLVGPLIDEDAVQQFESAIRRIREEGGEILCGGKRVARDGFFVEPTLVRAQSEMSVVGEETFAPILYLLRVHDLDEAIAVHNDVRQGLSSAIFTQSLAAAERFLSVVGSDCGIANVNLGTSGAEIGGAFGGEKETGGGREAGSDAWKAYMRRQTCTVNYGGELPLAQGVRFDIE